MFSSRNAPCCGRTAAHQLGVAQDLHRTVGGDAEVDDVVQAAALQRRDGDDDGVDVVSGAQACGISSSVPLHRDAVDGLAELGGVIVHRHHRVAVAARWLLQTLMAHASGLACAHDHHRAVGVLDWCCPAAARPCGWLRKSRQARRLPPTSRKDEHCGHGVGRVEQHAVDEAAVDQIDDDGGYADRAQARRIRSRSPAYFHRTEYTPPSKKQIR